MTTAPEHGSASGPEASKPGAGSPASRRRTRRRRRRIWWPIAWVVVGLLVLVHVGGGWYFAGRIESSALASTPSAGVPAYNDVQVTAISGDSVTLRRGPDAAENFDAPGRYGLAWQGGTGFIEAGTPNADGTVTRPFALDTGTPPAVGQLAAVDRAYWFTPEAATGQTPTTVMISGMPAWLFAPGAGASPQTMVIVVHGQNGSRLDGLRIVRTAIEKGEVLDITYRNDLGAPKDESGRLQYGATEWRDLDAAVQWALQHGSKHIVLAGQSMGGAVVAAFMHNSPRRNAVTGLVLDAPALSLADMVSYATRDMLPGGYAVPTSVVWTAERLATMRYGIDWGAINYVEDTSWVTAPTLILHGTADPSVPIELSRRLRDAKPDLVQLEEFPGALHAESWNFDTHRYDTLVTTFLDKIGA